MALADYTLCAQCNGKAFYDANIDWEDTNCGDIAALCRDCAVTHVVVVLPNGDALLAARARIAALEQQLAAAHSATTDARTEAQRLLGAVDELERGSNVGVCMDLTRAEDRVADLARLLSQQGAELGRVRESALDRLRVHDTARMADAWDEGFDAGTRAELKHASGLEGEANPYRKDKP